MAKRRRADDDVVDAGAREHYADADLYDFEYRRRRADVAFYVALARRLVPAGGTILELGAGSGRITLPLARAGFSVVAVDAAPAMLARLERRVAAAPKALRQRIRIVEGDLRTFAVGGRYPLVVAGFNVVEHLYTRVELAAFLGRVAAHLDDDGALAFDVQMPDPAWLARDPDRMWARTRFRHPRSGERLIYSTRHHYEPVSQIAIIEFHYQPIAGGAPTVVTLSQRKYFPAELEALLDASGFALAERYGDFDGKPLFAGALSQVVVARTRLTTRRDRRRKKSLE